MNKNLKTSALGSVAVLAGGGASALLLALTAGPGGATSTLTVDTLTDGVANPTDCTAPVTDSCSLRDAITAAADGDVIVFESGLAGTIALTNGELDIAVGLTITGAGSDLLTIDADGNSRVFYVGTTASDVTISGMKITGGDAGSSYGGGIISYNTGSLNLVDAEISGNAGDYGGGVYAHHYGDLNITNTVIADNSAPTGAGGLYTNSGVVDVNITDSSITGNTSGGQGAGGALGQGGDLVVTGSVIADNYSASGGGGFYAANTGSITISDTMFSGNTSDGWGGALYFNTSAQEITISNSTFDSNSAADNGGALVFYGFDQIVVINNSTIVGNSTINEGGGIWKQYGGSLTINQSTITENDAGTFGGGIYLNGGDSDVLLSGSIVSANTLTPVIPGALLSISGRLTGSAVVDGIDIAMDWADGDSFSSDHSLVGDISTGIVVTDLGGNIASGTPGLSPLADNGGATLTMALLANSVAVDAGPDPVATFAGNGFDQRGTPWVRVYNGLVDIGAYEVQPDPTPTTTTTTQDPTTPTTAAPGTTIAPDDTVVPAFTG